ncbi:MAG: hypothetical protein AAF518_07345 [Spirochaetota bacterium]
MDGSTVEIDKTIGDCEFTDLPLDDGKKFLHVRLKHSELRSKWVRCSKISDFISRFYSHPNPNFGALDKFQGYMNVISTVTNELVENAVKFSSGEEGEIEINLYSELDQFVLEISNCISAVQYKSFLAFLETLFDGGGNYEDKYYQRLEEVYDKPDETSSSVGLLMLLSHFPVRLGYRFFSEDEVIYATAKCILEYQEV